MTYRDRTQLIYETLNIIAKNPSITKSRVLYAVGLNYIQAEEIINTLIEKGLLIQNIDTSSKMTHARKTFDLTEKGFSAIKLITELNILINPKQSVEIII